MLGEIRTINTTVSATNEMTSPISVCFISLVGTGSTKSAGSKFSGTGWGASLVVRATHCLIVLKSDSLNRAISSIKCYSNSDFHAIFSNLCGLEIKWSMECRERRIRLVRDHVRLSIRAALQSRQWATPIGICPLGSWTRRQCSYLIIEIKYTHRFSFKISKPFDEYLPKGAGGGIEHNKGAFVPLRLFQILVKPRWCHHSCGGSALRAAMRPHAWRINQIRYQRVLCYILIGRAGQRPTRYCLTTLHVLVLT